MGCLSFFVPKYFCVVNHYEISFEVYLLLLQFRPVSHQTIAVCIAQNPTSMVNVNIAVIFITCSGEFLKCLYGQIEHLIISRASSIIQQKCLATDMF